MKKLIAFAMVLLLCLSIMPFAASAAEADEEGAGETAEITDDPSGLLEDAEDADPLSDASEEIDIGDEDEEDLPAEEASDEIPAEEDEDLALTALDGSSDAIGLNVTYHSAADIQAYASAHPASTSDSVTYATQPDTSSGTYTVSSLGVLSDSTLQSALNLFDQIRYIAGLNEVSLNSEYSQMMSAATLLNYLNGTLSHYPARPDGVDDELYSLGCSGAGSSNLAWGNDNLNLAILAWMSDSDSSNISALGHRRWILDPAMGATGFGATVLGPYYSNYYAMYAFDTSASSAGTQTLVAWPAQNTPVQYFSSSDAWSLSVGSSVTASNVTVTLVRQSDGQTWTFSSSSADGSFYVNNEGYGQKGCIIFQPSGIGSISPGDTFTVTITGAVSSTISYTVSFFDLDVPAAEEHVHSAAHVAAAAATCTTEGNIEYWYCAGCGSCFSDEALTTEISQASTVIATVPHTVVTDAAVAATCTSTGLTEGSHCSVCGAVIVAQEVVPMTDHQYVENVITAPTCTENGVSEYVCAVCGTTQTIEVAALGHDWGISEVLQEANCTEDGQAVYTCSRCGETKTDVIAALGHDWDDGVVTAEPTCTETGAILYTCTRCGETMEETMEALGHDYDGSCTCIRCGAADPDFVASALEGNDASYDLKTGGTLTFVSNDSIACFQRVLVDGQEISEDDYDVAEGSIRVTLKEAYLKGLSTGAHSLTIESIHGPVSFSFTITSSSGSGSGSGSAGTGTNESSSTEMSPQTGDSAPVALYAGTILLCGAALAVVILRKRRAC